ncbi:glycosyltransferase [Rhodophyticola sp. CCM32]|uniref:glycosyltransferase n=1 Tax=Rhodophyticola sp. CCM32 TaxID=2916397 RepID=UPI00107F21C9|nr:glycosyltransferase [Rhodophyticola sp. CCM32]QBY00385.1 glycosyltransferase [Rhodophyticola sp. CCM32]
MKILFLCITEPYPTMSGGTMRDWQNILACHSFSDVTVCFLNPKLGPEVIPHNYDFDDWIEIADSENRALVAFSNFWNRYFSPHWSLSLWSLTRARHFRKLLRTREFDFCVIEDQVLWKYALLASKHSIVVIDYHNHQSAVEKEVLFSIPKHQIIELISALRAYLYMIFVEYRIRDYFGFVCSKNDMLRRKSNNKTWVVENCLEPLTELERERVLSTVSRKIAKRTDISILYPGSLDYQPNILAVRQLCRQIFPNLRKRCPHATLTIVGKRAPQYLLRELGDLDGVEIKSDVPSMQPFFEKASCMCAPLTEGGGTRLKILESFKYGVPVITTTKGCEGLLVNNGQHLVVEDDISIYGHKIEILHKDHELRRRLIVNALSLFEDSYAYDTSAMRIRNALSEIRELIWMK